MADRKLTLFEIHLDGARFGAAATAPDTDRTSTPLADERPDDGTGDDDGAGGGAGCRVGRAARALLALGVLGALAAVVALGVALARRRGGGN